MLLQRILTSLPLKGRERITRPFLKYGEVEARSHGFSLRLDLHDYIQRCVFLNCFEYPDQRACAHLLQPGEAVIDIGANCGGYLALFAKSVGPEGYVLGFEPNPKLRPKLEYFIRENNVPQIDLRFIGLGEEAGELQLYMPPDGNNNEDATMCMVKGWNSVKVPVQTLDEVLSEHQERRFKLLKIDVEGMEQKILNGAKNSLTSGIIENLLVEFNAYWLEQQCTSCEQLFDFIICTGYELVGGQPDFEADRLLNLWFRRK